MLLISVWMKRHDWSAERRAGSGSEGHESVKLM
jgi:hypothetical protein